MLRKILVCICSFVIAGCASSIKAPPPIKIIGKPVVSEIKGCAKPVYPLYSIQNNEEGKVVVNMYIDVTGYVTETKIIQSSGFPSLDGAAQTMLSTCKFIPAMRGSTPVATWLPITYTWRLESSAE